MQVIVKGKQLDVGEALTNYVNERLEAGVSKYFDKAIDASVTVSRKNHKYHAECSVHVGSSIDVSASADHADAYACIDATVEKVEKQMRRYKRRLKKHHGKERSAQKMAFAAQSYVLAPESEETDTTSPESEEWHPIIIAESSADIPDCSVGEAVMRMDLANVPAMMFHNSGSKELNVIYRRPDGNIGWIDPKMGTTS